MTCHHSDFVLFLSGVDELCYVWVILLTGNSIMSTRAVYQEANTSLKQANAQKERLMLLEEWRKYEVSGHGRVSFVKCPSSSLNRFVVWSKLSENGNIYGDIVFTVTTNNIQFQCLSDHNELQCMMTLCVSSMNMVMTPLRRWWPNSCPAKFKNRRKIQQTMG